MALVRRIPQTETKPRTLFTMVGKVVKMAEKSMLIQRHGSKCHFWVDLNGRKIIPSEGDLIECEMFISSYIGKSNHFRWSLYFHNFRKLPEMGENICTFWGGKGEYEVVDVIKTEIGGTYILKAKNIDTNEIFHLQGYNTEEAPTKGKHNLTLDLITQPVIFSTEGLQYEDPYTVEYEKDGQRIVKDRKTGFPTLKIAFSLNLESHGEGDSSKDI